MALLLDFANTLDERSFTRHGVAHRGGDELATGASARRWLAGHALLAPGARLSADGLADLVTFRDGLRQALASKATAPAGAATLGQVNAALARVPFLLQFGKGGLPQLCPAADPHAWAAGLAAAIAAIAARGSWHRLRMCAASDCRWVFYDTSRRGGARWCSMAVCGNRIKTRRHRERQAQPGPE